MAMRLEGDVFSNGEVRGGLLGVLAERVAFLEAVDTVETECFTCAIDQRGRVKPL